MKIKLGFAVLSVALALTGCGGDSSSSGDTKYTNSFINKLANGNEYSCPSKAAFDTCKDDKTCMAATCTLTKQAVPVSSTTPKACAVVDKKVTGIANAVCQFTASDANAQITCAPNKMLIDGKIGNLTSSQSQFSSGANISGYTISCP